VCGVLIVAIFTVGFVWYKMKSRQHTSTELDVASSGESQRAQGERIAIEGEQGRTEARGLVMSTEIAAGTPSGALRYPDMERLESGRTALFS
jgi:hypothetical protein